MRKKYTIQKMTEMQPNPGGFNRLFNVEDAIARESHDLLSSYGVPIGYFDERKFIGMQYATPAYEHGAAKGKITAFRLRMMMQMHADISEMHYKDKVTYYAPNASERCIGLLYEKSNYDEDIVSDDEINWSAMAFVGISMDEYDNLHVAILNAEDGNNLSLDEILQLEAILVAMRGCYSEDSIRTSLGLDFSEDTDIHLIDFDRNGYYENHCSNCEFGCELCNKKSNWLN